MQLYQKGFSRDAWPSLAFTADEGRALHAVTNAVNIYDPASFSTGALLLPSRLCGWQPGTLEAPCVRIRTSQSAAGLPSAKPAACPVSNGWT